MPVQLSGSLLMSGSITATGLISAQGGISSVGAQQITDLSNAISFTSTASLYTNGGARITKDLYVSGTSYFNNVTIYGTQSVQYITSSQLNIGTNIITVNTDTPTVRYGGIAVYDSGSTGLTGSLLWDSEANHWIYTNPSGSTYSGGMMISGPRSSARGCEQGTTSCALMVGQGGDHITSSAVFHYGNATCFYGNATIQSSGATCLASTLSATKGTFTGTGYVLDLNRTDNTALIQLQYNGTVGSLLGTTGANNLTVYNASAAPILNLTSGIGCFSGAVCAPAFVGGTVSGTTGTFSSNAASLTFGANDTVEKYMTIRFSNGDFFVGGTSVQNYIYGAGSRNLALWTNSTQRFLIDGNGVSCFACQTCTPALDIMPSGIGVSTLGGIMRVVTGGTAVGIGVGQSNTNRYTQISANDLLVYNDDFFIATRCAFPLSIGTCYTSRLTFAATGIACFACRVCAPVITAGAGTSSQAIKITGDDNYIEFDNAGTYIKGGGNLTAAATSTFLLSTSANTRLTIAPAGEAIFACQVCMPVLLASGCVGIGTTAPGSPLEIYSSNVFNTSTGANPHLIINYNSATAGGPAIKFSRVGISDWSAIQADLSGGTRTLKFIQTSSGVASTQMVINANDGNVGIGTTSPCYKLDVSADINDGSIIRAVNLNSGAAATARFYAENNIGNLGQLTTYSSGFGFTVFGLAAGNYSALLSSGASSAGLLIGSLTSSPVVFGTNNIERLRITSTGIACFACTVCAPMVLASNCVGIGTTAPDSLLHVLNCSNTPYSDANALASGQWFRISNPSTCTGATSGLLFVAQGPSGGNGIATINGVTTSCGSMAITFGTRDASGNVTERMRIASAGCISVGTTCTLGRLTVASEAGTSGVTLLNTTAATLGTETQFITWEGLTNGSALHACPLGRIGVVNVNGGTSIGSMVFYTKQYNAGICERMRITSDGCVGIGTTTPAEKFVVSETTNPSQITLKQETNFNLGIIGQLNYIGGGTGAKSAMIESNRVGSSATNAFRGGDLRFYTKVDDTFDCLVERMRIASGGDVGIGITDPASFSARLTVLGNIRASNGCAIGVWDSSNTTYVQLSSPGTRALRITNDANAEYLRITSAGRIGIGETAPVSALVVSTPSDTSSIGQSGIVIQGSSTLTAGCVLALAFTAIPGTSRARAAVGSVVGSDWGKGNLAFYTRDASDATSLSTADERMRITSGGGVVIGGTVASNVGLTIYGSNAATIYQTPNTGTGAGNGFYVGHTGDISYIWNYNNYPTVFATNNTERMRITNCGCINIVGVGNRLNFDTTDGPSTVQLGTVNDYVFRLQNNRGVGTIMDLGNNHIDFYSNGSLRQRIFDYGNVCFACAVCTPAGVRFGGGATTLNYYEEGTFTPRFCSAGFSSITYGSGQNGYYTRIGRLVFISINIMTEAITSSGTNQAVTIRCLPFTSANLNESSVGLTITDNSRYDSCPPINATINPNTNIISLFVNLGLTGAGTDPTPLYNQNFSTGAGNRNITRLSGVYITS